jgi:hypothetical protein
MACNAFYQIDTRIQLWEAGYSRLRGTQNIFVVEYLFTTGWEIAMVKGRTKEAASAASVPATDRAMQGTIGYRGVANILDARFSRSRAASGWCVSRYSVARLLRILATVG